MKILQVCSARAIGGGEKHLADLAHGLTERGHEIYAALRPNSPLRSHLSRVRDENVLTLRAPGPLNIANAYRLARFMREQQIEIVHAHIAHDYLLAALAARLAGNARLVVTRHVLFPLKTTHARLLQRVDAVIAVSHAVAGVLKVQNIFDSSRIVVIHNGIDLTRFFPNSSSRDSNSFRVGMVGHLAPIKGQDEFIRAARIVTGERNDVTFIIAGEDKSRSGENRQHLERLIRDLGLNERVQLIGWVDDVPSLLSTLDLLISPSRSEPFGLSIIEGMAAGVPVIATSSEGAREILEDGVTGQLLSSGNPEELARAIVGLLDDEARRKSFSENALAAVRDKFSLERMVDDTEQLYRTILKKGP